MEAPEATILGPILLASASAVYVFDPTSLAVVEANPAAAALYGYDLADFLTLTVDRLVDPSAWDIAKRAIDAVRDPDAENLHVDAHGNPFRVWVHAFNLTVEGRVLRCCQVENIAKFMSTRVFVEQQLRGMVQTVGGVLRLRDPYTDRHQMRVADLAGHIAKQLGLTADEQAGIIMGALLHDIGKLAVPSEILAYSGRLTDTQMAFIRGHAQAGRDLIADTDSPWPIADMVLQHHERLDGSGYPNQLRGDAILPATRVIAVADVAEAISSHRPYRPAHPLAVALLELEGGAGTQFDADVVHAAVTVMTRPGFELHPDAFGG